MPRLNSITYGDGTIIDIVSVNTHRSTGDHWVRNQLQPFDMNKFVYPLLFETDPDLFGAIDVILMANGFKRGRTDCFVQHRDASKLYKLEVFGIDFRHQFVTICQSTSPRFIIDLARDLDAEAEKKIRAFVDSHNGPADG